jgi:hypothetical protein
MEPVMTEHETLTDLVAEALGNGLTYRAFEDAAVDPTSGYRPGRSTLWKLSKGQTILISPELVLAVAHGLGVSPERAQRAAAVQYAGYYSPTPVDGATVLRDPDAPDAPLHPERALVADWDAKDTDTCNHQSG